MIWGNLPPLESMEENKRACSGGGRKEDGGDGNRQDYTWPVQNDEPTMAALRASRK